MKRVGDEDTKKKVSVEFQRAFDASLSNQVAILKLITLLVVITACVLLWFSCWQSVEQKARLSRANPRMLTGLCDFPCPCQLQQTPRNADSCSAMFPYLYGTIRFVI